MVEVGGGAALRARWAGCSTPDRLRRVGAVVVTACVVAAVVSVVGGSARAAAVQEAGGRVAALTADAAQIYQALADADAAATSGYVSGGVEPPALRARYDADVARAAAGLTQAAGRLGAGDAAPGAVAAVTTIGTQLPVYTGLIETARTYDRQGLPLGQSYLGSGSTLMRTTILPAAAELRRLETAELAADSARGAAPPLAVLLLGLAALAGLVDVSLCEYRRTRRVLSPGLAGAAALVVAALVWWVVAAATTAAALDDAADHGTAVTALDDARTAASQARSNESLVLVARGGGSDEVFDGQLARIRDVGGLLDVAAARGADVGDARSAAQAWSVAHRRVRDADLDGRYTDAVALAVGPDPAGSAAGFTALDATLSHAVEAQRAAFGAAVDRAGAAQVLLAWGPAVLLLLAGAAAAAGVARRTAEYR